MPIVFSSLGAASDLQKPYKQEAREVAAQFAAELTRVALAPLAKALGFYGDVAVASTALAIARHESGGLTDALERVIERAR